MILRKPVATDIRAIHRLINDNARQNRILERSLGDLYENVRGLIVAEAEAGGGKLIVGVCALQIMWADLAEIRSLSVAEGYKNRGIGRALVQRAEDEALALGIRRVFSLTYVPEFFRHLGYRDVDKSELPHKIWSVCINCPQFPDCDEWAVMKEIGSDEQEV